jgi:subtilisin-like proprotein convertase family protein
MADADTLADLDCGFGEVAAWDGSSWACAFVTDGDSLAELGATCADGDLVLWDDALGAFACAPPVIAEPGELVTVLEGAVLDLGAGTTLDGSPLLTADDAVSLVLDALAASGVDESAMPFNGLNEISNDLITNQFIERFSNGDAPIPDNNPIGVNSVIDVPDIGVAEWLIVSVNVTNSNIAGVRLELTGPDGSSYLLFAGGASGPALVTAYPTPTLPVTGDLTTWIGRNPVGEWTLRAVDSVFLDNTFDGEIVEWSIEFQHVSNQQVEVQGKLLVDEGAEITGGLDVSGPVTFDTPFDLPEGTTINGRALSYLTYTRWGKTTCPASQELVYSGFAVSGNYSHGGGSADFQCLHPNPEWLTFSDGNQNGALLYPTEYETSGYGITDRTDRQNHEVPCSVCLRPAAVQLMIPGRVNCPAGWTRDYYGYLMGNWYAHSNNNQLVCVDVDMDRIGSSANENGALLYPTEWEGSSRVSGYVQDRELTCVVCSK